MRQTLVDLLRSGGGNGGATSRRSRSRHQNKLTEYEFDRFGYPGVRHVLAAPDGRNDGDRDRPQDEEVQRREDRACPCVRALAYCRSDQHMID